MVEMSIPKCLLILTFLLPFTVQNAREKYKILALMPYNGKSHFDFAVVLFEELARRGHDITVLSQFSRKTLLPNYHEISVADEKTSGVNLIDMNEINSKWDISKMLVFFNNGVERICEQSLSHPNVEKLIKSRDKYDLIIAEMFNADCFLGFVHKFNASLITLRTSTLSTWLNDRTGNPDNPAYVPGTTSGNPSRMNFAQRLGNTLYYVAYKMLYRIYDSWCEEIAKRHFGEDMPSLESIAERTSLYLVNTHFVNQFAKPLMPNVKEVAGMHVRKPKPLPKDLENWISAGSHGLIYLNFGSMLKASSMARHKWLAFVRVFAQLPTHRVLVKWDAETAAGLPKNVRLTKWALQNDVLHHPSTKLFITHGGMLGTVEALHAGVPMLIVPFFGDQMTNAALLQERGVGVRLMYEDITFDKLNETLHDVLFDESYAKRTKELSAAFRDRPIAPLEEAAFWVEYVARHKDTAAANAMRSPALHLRLHQYLLLDVLAVIVLLLVLIAVLIGLILLYISKIIRDVAGSVLRLAIGGRKVKTG